MKHFLLALVICNLFAIGAYAQVGINTTSPNDKSILDLNSNNKGLLIPRLTKVEISALSLVATDAGMLVYCTDLDLFCYYNGTDWMSMPTWGQKIDLVDPTAEQNIIPNIMNSASGVGVGTTDPQSKLTVLGNLAIGKDSIAPSDGAYILGKVRIGPDAGINSQLEVGGSINTRGKLKEYGNDLLPAGSIVLWYGSTASIPAGWGWCDGSTYPKSDGSGNIVSPDLSGRFVMGAGSSGDQILKSDGTTSVGVPYNHIPNNIGGFDEVGLTVAQMPTHNHDYSLTNNGKTATDTHKHSWSWTTDGDFDNDGGGTNDTRITLGDQPPVIFSVADISSFNAIMRDRMDNNTHNHAIYPRGDNASHENRPPYYVLAYIIKL